MKCLECCGELPFGHPSCCCPRCASEKEQEVRKETDHKKDLIRRSRRTALDQIDKLVASGAVDDAECAVRDTLANLMHYCSEKGIDFDDEMR